MLGVDEVVESVVGGSGWGLGIGLAIGGALLVRAGARPLAKTAIKGYLAVSEAVREGTAGMSESVQDLYAEVRAERDQGRQSTAEAE